MQKQNLDELRHSTAHLMAAAVLELFPGTQNAIGPAVENGFYTDFDFGDVQISETDFTKIEAKMREIVKTWKKFEVKEVTPDEAKKLFKHNKYKTELIEDLEKKGEKITVNNPGGFLDLCRGGHLDNPANEISAFKLLSIAGAYWKGSEKNKMLTRIYGTVFPTKKELDEHLAMLEEAKMHDHKKLGKELDLFVFSETVGKGLPLWTPKGSTIRRELERFIVDEEIRRGYLHVYTPDLANLALYEKSGHYPFYKESMYAPIKIDDEQFMLRPMSCPHHFELYLSNPHSYKELPIRYAELAKLYRYEQSGELAGLQRVRSFTLADAHIIVSTEESEKEVSNVLDLIDDVSKILGIQLGKDYWYRLSLGDKLNEKKYFKDDASWDHAEKVLRNALKKRNADFVEAEGEAAFYGPKIDVQMKNVNGKEDTAFTVQYDFVMPKRFNLKYINAAGEEIQPVVIHRSSIGAIERIMAFLIEKYAGAFPTWLAPVQMILLPIADRHIEFTEKVNKELREKGFRSEVDTRSERLQAKIRDAALQKVPFMGIIGDNELENNAVSVRARGGEDLGSLSIESLINQLQEKIDKKI
ncbi:MAG TPA: threonine--tRNA ligase [Candidatus Saccharimonadales bacterium]|nr:threonine--tRNA ligase [Candidatus Saccharimonadales bacterium]